MNSKLNVTARLIVLYFFTIFFAISFINYVLYFCYRLSAKLNLYVYDTVQFTTIIYYLLGLNLIKIHGSLMRSKSSQEIMYL